MNLGRYGKTVTALVTGLIGWATQVAYAPGGFSHITAVQWIAFATAWAVSFGVYAVANQPTAADLPVIVRLHPDDIAALSARAPRPAAAKKR